MSAALKHYAGSQPQGLSRIMNDRYFAILHHAPARIKPGMSWHPDLDRISAATGRAPGTIRNDISALTQSGHLARYAGAIVLPIIETVSRIIHGIITKSARNMRDLAHKYKDLRRKVSEGKKKAGSGWKNQPLTTAAPPPPPKPMTDSDFSTYLAEIDRRGRKKIA